MNDSQHVGATRRTFVAGLGSLGLLGVGGCRATGGIAVRGLGGDTVRVASADLRRFARSLDGALWEPAQPEYEDARRIWNARIDRRPARIVRAASTADVAATLRFASDRGLLLAIRSGGHNHRGHAVCDGGIVLDLRGLDAVTVVPGRDLARVGPGVTFGSFDATTHRAGLAATGAIVSDVGLPGYLLGGGIGWLHRALGAGCDRLAAAELVTANGEVHEVDADRTPNVLWGLRGGGGNLGVVTRFDLRLAPLKHVHAGLLFFDLEAMDELAPQVDAWLDEAPDELNVWMFHRRAPRSKALPAELHGRHVWILGVTWAGDPALGPRVVAPLRGLRQPLFDTIRVRSYPQWQAALDGAWGPGYQNEWVGHYLDALPAAAVRTVGDFVSRVPSPFSDVKLARLGGAFGRGTDSAFGFRDARYAFVVQSRWLDPADSESQLEWTRSFHGAMARHATGQVYANFVGDSPAQPVTAAYEPASLQRLRDLKRQCDPRNLLRCNLNVTPA